MQAEIKSNWSVRRLVFDDNEGCERCLDVDEKERHETTDQELYFLLTTKNDMPKIMQNSLFLSVGLQK